MFVFPVLGLIYSLFVHGVHGSLSLQISVSIFPLSPLSPLLSISVPVSLCGCVCVLCGLCV